MMNNKDYKKEYLSKLKRIKITKYIVFSVCVLALLISLIWHNDLTKAVNPKYYTQCNYVLYNNQNQISNVSMKIHYIDVGCADCTFIELPDNKCALIDCAGDVLDKDKSVQAMMLYLNNNIYATKDKIIDYFIITHPDLDHISGVSEILKNFQVKNIIRPKVLAKDEKQKISQINEYSFASTYKTDYNLQYYEQINSIYTYLDKNKQTKMYFATFGLNFSNSLYDFEFLTPKQDEYVEDNDYSCAIRLGYANQNYLFMSDCTALGESEILDYYASFDIEKLQSKFLKVGHHGSNTSSGYAFLNAVKAEYYIESTRAGVYSNIPSGDVQSRIENSFADTKILRTDVNGNILINANSVGDFSIQTSQGSFYFVTHNVFIKWYYYVICITVLCFILIFSIKLKSYEQMVQSKKNKIEKQKQKMLKVVGGMNICINQ